MPAKRTVAIIGAGVGGMATANILARAGFAVTVYEKQPTPGGRMGKLELDGFTFDTGPSWYLMKEVFEQYFALFHKTPEDYYELTRLDPAYKVFFETRDPVTVTGNFEANRRTFEALEPGAGRALERYVATGGRNYEHALRYFLYNTFTRPHRLAKRELLRALPAFLPVFATSLHGYVSRRFKTAELQQILEYPSVFLGASPFNTPALYQLMSFLDFNEGVFYPKQGGMYAVVDGLRSLGEETGVTYTFNADVERIITKHRKVQGIIVNGQTIEADIVVANSDLHHTETRLLDEQDRSYPERYWQKRQAGPSALLMYLGVKGDLPELEHHNLFFVRDWRGNFDAIYKAKTWPESASMYVSKTTATDRSTAPEGHENVFVLVPLPPGAGLDPETTERYTEKYLTHLEHLSGVTDLRNRIVTKQIRTPDHFGSAFNAWQNTALGMSHTLRQSAFLRPAVKSRKIKDLYYVGSGTQPGIGVPMCIISAQLVYKHLAGDTSPSRPLRIEEIA